VQPPVFLEEVRVLKRCIMGFTNRELQVGFPKQFCADLTIYAEADDEPSIDFKIGKHSLP